MPRCPHCGEPVKAGQKTCFACGQKVHVRSRRARAGLNPVILIAAAAVILLGGGGLIIGLSGSGRQNAAEKKARELARVQDSVRQVNRMRSDSARKQTMTDDVSRAKGDIDKLEGRLTSVTASVVKDQPGPKQAQIIGQTKAQIARLRQLAATFSTTPDDKKPALRAQLRDGERQVQDLISNLARATSQ